MGQQQPALVQLDRRAAIAHLNQLPRLLGRYDLGSLVPVHQVVGADQEDVLAVLAADHAVLTSDLARKQGHALVTGGRAGEGLKAELAEVVGGQQFRADARTGVGGIGAAVDRAGAVVEQDQAKVLQPVPLGVGEGEDHGARQRGFRMAVGDHGTVVHAGRTGFCVIDSGGEGRFGHQVEAPFGRQDALPEGDGGDVAFTDGAQGHDETDAAGRQAGLVHMRYDAGVHQGGGGVGILVAEEGADQLLLAVAQLQVKAHLGHHLAIAGHEDGAGLPVAGLEILTDEGQFQLAGAHVHVRHRVDDAHGALALPAGARIGRDVEGPDHDPRGIGRQPQRQMVDLRQVRTLWGPAA